MWILGSENEKIQEFQETLKSYTGYRDRTQSSQPMQILLLMRQSKASTGECSSGHWVTPTGNVAHPVEVGVLGLLESQLTSSQTQLSFPGIGATLVFLFG